MKTLKMMILGVVMLSFGIAKAASVDGSAKLTRTYVIHTYVDAMTHGKLAGLSTVLDKDVKFSILRGKQLLSFNKEESLAFLKTTEDVEQNCVTSSSISESNPDMSVAKVDMKYQDFTRTNYITLTNTSDGWKITSIYSVFKNN